MRNTMLHFFWKNRKRGLMQSSNCTHVKVRLIRRMAVLLRVRKKITACPRVACYQVRTQSNLAVRIISKQATLWSLPVLIFHS